jgi:hypothetical protein
LGDFDANSANIRELYELVVLLAESLSMVPKGTMVEFKDDKGPPPLNVPSPDHPFNSQGAQRPGATIVPSEYNGGIGSIGPGGIGSIGPESQTFKGHPQE